MFVDACGCVGIGYVAGEMARSRAKGNIPVFERDTQWEKEHVKTCSFSLNFVTDHLVHQIHGAPMSWLVPLASEEKNGCHN